MARPLIAIPAYHLAPGRVSRWSTGGFAAPANYVEAIGRAGGRAALLASPDDADPGEILAPFDGLMLLGGGDLDPVRSGGAPDDRAYGLEPNRDALEFSVLSAADRAGMPTLAICRGFQVLNVAFGGTLHPHLPDVPDLIAHGVPGGGKPASHEVALTTGSRTHEAMGVDAPSCSSHHHQGVETVGEGLIVAGRSADGLVEALERPQGWMVGVQWHPEDTAPGDAAQQGLFDELVLRARRSRVPDRG
ncbi:MAG: gamma-glutamyl-gamma-aminobutyrate hydrolase family protein [Actinomycetota bacterium]